MKTKIDCKDCKNLECFVQQGCTGEWLEKINNNKNQYWCRKGSFIFQEGEPIQGIHFIQQGGVKVVTGSLHGREQIVRLAKAGQILGHRGLGKTFYFFNAVALTDTLVCLIDNDLFQETCLNCPQFAYNLIFFYASELRRAELRVKYQAQMNIREKVAMAFVYIHEVFGLNPETRMLNISLSRRDLADIAGTSSEQVTRQLSDFETEQLISRKKRTIEILSINGLEEIVSEYRID